MNAEVYNHLKWMIQSAYETTGVSQLSAQSKKPAGLDSGVALREFSDIETERFMLTGQRWEQMFLEASKIIIEMSRDMYTEDKTLAVTIPGHRFIESIKWKDVDLTNDQFVMKVFPTSLLPTTPAGRLQKVQELIQAGFISKENGIALLDFPDLGAYESLETSNLNLIKKTVTDIVDMGKYQPPEVYMNLDHAIQHAHKSYLEGRVNNLPEERLELLLRFIDDCERLKILSQPEQPVIAEETQATAEQQPTSDLIPQVDPLL
jgi:hypothetical protein